MVEEIQKYKMNEDTNGYCNYIVQFQDQKFCVNMTEDELKESSHIAVEIMKELQRINVEGLNRMRIMEMNHRIENSDQALIKLQTYREIQNTEIVHLIIKAATIMRVGGALYFLISRPAIDNVIYAVYAEIVDNFDNEQLYRICAYFLLRGIFKMRGFSGEILCD